MLKRCNFCGDLEKRKPDYRGNGVVAWINKTPSGIEYLNIKLTGHLIIRAYRELHEDIPLKVTEEVVK